MKRVEHLMGTAISFEVRDLTDGAASTAVDEAIERLRWVDRTFSTYRPESEISLLGRGEMRIEDCAAEVREVLALCDDVRLTSNGYFDAYRYPSRRLDPSGLVKGWAIDEASDLLLAHGSRYHCVNAGGDVRARGTWNIGVVHPFDRGMLTTIVGGDDLAVATSGTAERGLHVFDPRTGAAATALASVTVVGPHLTFTDAYATAAFAMGHEAPAWLETLPEHEAYVIDAGGFVWESRGFGKYKRAA